MCKTMIYIGLHCSIHSGCMHHSDKRSGNNLLACGSPDPNGKKHKTEKGHNTN